MPSHGPPASSGPQREASELPRRAFLGLTIEADATGGGVRVVRVAPHGTAQRAGVAPGDKVVAINHHPVGSATDLVAATRVLRAGDSARLTVRRDETELELVAASSALPLESERACLGHVIAAGRRLRTIALSPTDAPSKAAILYLQSADWSSCEYPHTPRHPVRRLLEALTDVGFATWRLERPGVGDSEGESTRDVDFLEEMAGYREALHRVSAHHESVFLFGNSLGGMVAPRLARDAAGAQTKLAGIVVFGTSPATWHECMLGSFERHNEHLPPAAMSHQLALLTELQELVFREGRLPDRVFRERPHLRAVGFDQLAGETCYGRTARFFQQLEALHLRDAWAQIEVPVLALHGSLDRVCTHEDAREIAALVGSHAEARELEGVDHGLASAGAVERVATSAAAWMDRVVEARSREAPAHEGPVTK